jgi:hypothetical protein
MTADAHELCCSRCGGPRDRPGQRYCRSCHAAYKRNWRKLQQQMLDLLADELRAVAYGKTVSRQTLDLIEKRSKG